MGKEINKAIAERTWNTSGTLDLLLQILLRHNQIIEMVDVCLWLLTVKYRGILFEAIVNEPCIYFLGSLNSHFASEKEAMRKQSQRSRSRAARLKSQSERPKTMSKLLLYR